MRNMDLQSTSHSILFCRKTFYWRRTSTENRSHRIMGILCAALLGSYPASKTLKPPIYGRAQNAFGHLNLCRAIAVDFGNKPDTTTPRTCGGRNGLDNGIGRELTAVRFLFMVS